MSETNQIGIDKETLTAKMLEAGLSFDRVVSVVNVLFYDELHPDRKRGKRRDIKGIIRFLQKSGVLPEPPAPKEIAATPEVAEVIAKLPNVETLRAKMCEAKRDRFRTLYQARKTLREITERHGKGDHVSVVYRCPFCGKYHIGRQMSGKRLGKTLSDGEVYTLEQLEAMEDEIQNQVRLDWYEIRRKMRIGIEQLAIRRAPRGERRDYVFATCVWEDDGGTVV